MVNFFPGSLFSRFARIQVPMEEASSLSIFLLDDENHFSDRRAVRYENSPSGS
jgi:hypothetical protein